jgi:hypothetical protein
MKKKQLNVVIGTPRKTRMPHPYSRYKRGVRWHVPCTFTGQEGGLVALFSALVWWEDNICKAWCCIVVPKDGALIFFFLEFSPFVYAFIFLAFSPPWT